jgi:hypothetical protein
LPGLGVRAGGEKNDPENGSRRASTNHAE